MVAQSSARIMSARVSTSWSTSMETALVAHVTLEFIAAHALTILRCSQERYLSRQAILISLLWALHTRPKCFHPSTLQHLFKHILSLLPHLQSLYTQDVAHVKLNSLLSLLIKVLQHTSTQLSRFRPLFPALLPWLSLWTLLLETTKLICCLKCIV